MYAHLLIIMHYTASLQHLLVLDCFVWCDSVPLSKWFPVSWGWQMILSSRMWVEMSYEKAANYLSYSEQNVCVIMCGASLPCADSCFLCLSLKEVLTRVVVRGQRPKYCCFTVWDLLHSVYLCYFSWHDKWISTFCYLVGIWQEMGKRARETLVSESR